MTVMNLNEVFEEDVLDRYNDYTGQIANDFTIRPEENDQFLFAAIQTTGLIIFYSNPANDGKYISNISDKIRSSGGEIPTEDGQFQISNYIGEILQNSFDHPTKNESSNIDIDIKFDDAGGLTYRHNGAPFGYETRFKDSTLSGLITPDCRIKRLDYRVGTFGIGFKIWVYFFKQFNFKSVKGNEMFTFTVKATKNGEDETFEAEVTYDSDCNEEDTIEFQFSGPKFPNDSQNTPELVRQHASHMMSFFTNKEVEINITDPENQQHSLSSQITELTTGGGLPTQEVKVVDQEGNILVHQLNVIPDMQALVEERLDVPAYGKYASKTWMETIQEVLPQNETHQEWFDPHQFTIAFNLLDETEDNKPLLSVLQPVPEDLRGYDRMKFDAPFFLRTDRQRLIGMTGRHPDWKDSLNHSIQLRLMKIAMKYLSGLAQDADLKMLMFDDSFSEWGEEFKFKNTSIDLNLLDEEGKTAFSNAMERIDGSLFAQEDERYVISVNQKVGVWLNENLTDVEKQAFDNVLSFDGNFVTWNRSIAARDFPPLPTEDIVDKLNAFGKFGDFSLAFPDEPGALLPDGKLCIFLVENDVELNEDVAHMCDQFKATEILELAIHYEGNESENADYLQFKKTLDANNHAQIELLTKDTKEADILNYLAKHLGGYEVCQDTFELISKHRHHSPSMVRAAVSLWDGEEAFEHEMQALVCVPKNSVRDHPRAYPLNSDVMAPPNPFLGCYLGLPTPPEKTPQGSWWDAESYPTLADEGKNLIYLASHENQIPNKDHLSLIVGSPWNTTEICEFLCAAISSEIDRIIKVDVSDNEHDVSKTVSLWKTPLPLALEITTLREKGLDEYNLANLQNNDGTPVKDSRPLQPDSKGNVNPPWKSYISPKLSGSRFETLTDTFVFTGNRLRTSGLRLRYLRWCNVFYGDQLDDRCRILAMYSKTQAKVSGRTRTYVGRIGRKHAQVEGFSFAMSTFAASRDISTVDSTDGIWALAEPMNDTHKPIPGPLNPNLQANSERILPMQYFTEMSAERANFTDGIVELFSDGDLTGNEFNMFCQAVGGGFGNLSIHGNPKLNSAKRNDIKAKGSELATDLENILRQFQNTNRVELLEEYRRRSMNPQENMSELYEEEYRYAFEAYRGGIDISSWETDKGGLYVISQSNREEYLLKWPMSKTYDGWMPLKAYRVINNEFTTGLFGTSDDSFATNKRLISKQKPGEWDISMEELPEDWELCSLEDEAHATWKVSLETIQQALRGVGGNNSIEVKLYTAPPNTVCRLFDNEYIGLGNSGWDVRCIDKTYCFVTSKVTPEKVRMELFMNTIDRFQTFLRSKAADAVSLNREHLEDAYASLDVETPWYGVSSWFDEHIVSNYEELEQQCLQGGLSDVYELLKDGIRELLEGEGDHPPGSAGSRCVGMRMFQTEEQVLEHFKPSKMRRVMDIWYEHTPSMAADEPLFQTLGPNPKTYYANLFLHHDQNTMMPRGGGSERERRMRRCNIDNFFGSRIGLSNFFFMLAKTEGKIKLNDENGESLERFIIQYSGNGPLDPELHLPDALLVDGEPTTLRIHPFHLAAMAAVETALNNFEQL